MKHDSDIQWIAENSVVVVYDVTYRNLIPESHRHRGSKVILIHPAKLVDRDS